MSTRDEISRVSVKAPPFWQNNVGLWFSNLESQFVIAGISTEETKFHYVVASLDSEVSSRVADLITTPPDTNPFQTLKQRLVQEFSESETTQIKSLLSDMTLGELKPSQLLHKMSQLAAKRLDDNILKMLWLQRLPVTLQQILSASSDKLSGLASIADRVYEVSDLTPSISDVSSESQRVSKLEKQIEDLTELVQKSLRLNRSRSSSKNRRNSQSPDRRNGQPCWYHARFGAKARKCIKPCGYRGNS